MVPNAFDLEKLYEQHFGDMDQLTKKIQMWNVLCKYYFQNDIPINSTTLDVGWGYCEFINNIESHNKYVIDLNQEVLKCANSNVTAFVGDIQSFKKSGLISPENSGINIVFISNFLEHLASKEAVYSLIKEVK